MLDQNLPITNCKTFTEPNSPRAERNQWRSPHWSDTQHFNSKWNLFWELLILVAAQFSMIYYLPDWYWLEELRPSQSSPVVSPHHDFLRPKLCYINGAKAPLNNKPSGGICQRWWSDNKITSLSVWRGHTRPDQTQGILVLNYRNDFLAWFHPLLSELIWGLRKIPYYSTAQCIHHNFIQ